MRVIVDCDPGLGKKYSLADVDDGLALFFMLNQPEMYEIEGITITYGNTTAKTGYKLLENYLKLTDNIEIPHYLGATSNLDLGKLTEASKFLISKVKENPKEMTLLTLGPLTNLASAMIKYQEFLDDLKQIIFMGGVLNPRVIFSFNEKNEVENSEFNFRNDSIATKHFIEADTNTTRIGMGLDVCCQVVFNRSHYERIKSRATLVTQYISENIQNWLELWEKSLSKGFYPFDTLVPIYLIRKDLFKVVDFHLKVDTEIIPGKVMALDKSENKLKSISYCTDFISEQSKKDFMEVLITGLTI
jgi:purine nucleosidase